MKRRDSILQGADDGAQFCFGESHSKLPNSQTVPSQPRSACQGPEVLSVYATENEEEIGIRTLAASLSRWEGGSLFVEIWWGSWILIPSFIGPPLVCHVLKLKGSSIEILDQPPPLLGFVIKSTRSSRPRRPTAL